ncbi:phosphotransferase [bacterium]|nr:phosphotransferase [bacterium]
MKLIGLHRKLGSVRRYRAILHILLKYGFEDVIDRLHIGHVIRKGQRMLLRKQGREFLFKTRFERIRLAIEELGPTTIKFGQMLSTRYDVFPDELIQELRKLQDEVTPIPDSRIRAIIESEWGKPVESLFRSFESQPVASASLAQVHRATTLDGDRVAVKVQKPDVPEIIQGDMIILKDLARLIEKHIPESASYDPVGLVEEFESWLRQETDFLQEGRSIERFRMNFRKEKTLFVPKVYWNLTSSRILTMEFVEGIPVLQTDRFAPAGLDPKQIAKNGASAILKQVFEHGFFHGDPHPGNIFVLENNVIALLDFGLMGNLDEDLVTQIGDLMAGILDKNVGRVVRVLFHVGSIRQDVHLASLKSDLSSFINRYYGSSLSQLCFEQVFNDLNRIVTRHHIRIPRNLMLMGKALVQIEGIARTLDPEFDMFSMAKPYAARLITGRYDIRRLLKKGSQMAGDFAEMMNDLPYDIQQILAKIRSGELGINLHHQGFSNLIREMDRSTNRLSFSLIIASLIIASSLIIHSQKGPYLFGVPAFGLVGFTLAGILGLWLVVAIIRSGKL